MVYNTFVFVNEHLWKIHKQETSKLTYRNFRNIFNVQALIFKGSNFILNIKLATNSSTLGANSYQDFFWSGMGGGTGWKEENYFLRA